MHVPEWSVYFGYPAGNTIHLVDSGIDTGPLLKFYPVSMAGVRSIATLRAALLGSAHEHLALTIRDLATGALKPVAQTPGAGRQYFRMHRALVEQVEQLLAAGYRPPPTKCEWEDARRASPVVPPHADFSNARYRATCSSERIQK